MFDCDGVLVDSEPLSFRAWSAVTAARGERMTESQFTDSIGTTDRDVARIWGERLGCDPTVLLDEADRAFLEVVTETSVFEDALALRRSISVPVGVATNSERWRLDAILGATGLTEQFPATVTSDEVSHPKPAPDVYLDAFRMIGVSPFAGLVVEDSPSGITSAKAAGAYVVAVNRGHIEESLLSGADLIVTTLSEAVV